VNVLTGIYQPEAGEIFLDGTAVKFPSSEAAAAAGLSAIHQETVLFDELTVAETLKFKRKAILVISHSFAEIFRSADRCTVFRDGQFVGAGQMREGRIAAELAGDATTPEALVRAAAGLGEAA